MAAWRCEFYIIYISPDFLIASIDRREFLYTVAGDD